MHFQSNTDGGSGRLMVGIQPLLQVRLQSSGWTSLVNDSIHSCASKHTAVDWRCRLFRPVVVTCRGTLLQIDRSLGSRRFVDDSSQSILDFRWCVNSSWFRMLVVSGVAFEPVKALGTFLVEARGGILRTSF